MVHAGVYPGWNFKQLKKRAGEVEAILQSAEHITFFENMYGKQPVHWDKRLTGWDRLRFITNVLTRMRYCDHNGNLDFLEKRAPVDAPETLIPWFRHPRMECNQWKIVFGHWSSLGFFRENNIIALDSGCVWGGCLTAIELDGEEPGRHWQVSCD